MKNDKDVKKQANAKSINLTIKKIREFNTLSYYDLYLSKYSMNEQVNYIFESLNYLKRRW